MRLIEKAPGCAGRAFVYSWFCVALLGAQGLPQVSAKFALPPMGWSSWNSFSNTIDSQITMQQARFMAGSDLKKSGYEYVNIDEGWWLGDRDAEGNIVVDPKAWPPIKAGEVAGDMSNIVRFIHSLGLKAGIYTDAGKDGCSMYPDLGPAYFHVGSEGHYEQDFLQFARWGFDYVKIDWCGGAKENLDPDVQYSEVARAIARAEKITGHQLYFSICNWGKQSPWSWGPGVGGAVQSIWRTSDDIVAPIVAGSANAGRKAAFDHMLSNFDQGIHPEAEHTGFYNDPDMMVLGMPGLNAAQNRLHIALWAISGAPLLVGADLTRLDSESLATLTNADVIRIDQDGLGLQAIKVSEAEHGLEVWSKFLSNPGERAVVLLNRTHFPAPLSVKWADLGLSGDTASVREVWTGKDLGNLNESYEATVPAEDGILLIVKGTEGALTHYEPAAGESQEEEVFRQSETRFTGVSAHQGEWAQVRINYKNTGAEPRLVALRVNGQDATRVEFPPTGEGQSTVWVEAHLDRPGTGNLLNFATAGGHGLKIDSIDVH
jgi:hypothetical protein